MGIFDDFLGGVFSLPGKIVETTVEAVVRLPEVPIKIVKGVVDGVEKGIEKLDDAVDL